LKDFINYQIITKCLNLYDMENNFFTFIKI
jgi:hypothetical protein